MTEKVLFRSFFVISISFFSLAKFNNYNLEMLFGFKIKDKKPIEEIQKKSH